MQLRQSEPLRIENNHHGGVRHVNSHFYYRSRNQYLCLPVDEALHFRLLFCWFHLPVHLTHTVIRECFFQRFKAVFKVFQVYFFAFFDKRKHDIHLSSLFYLLSDALIEARHLSVELMNCLYRFAPGRQLVYHAYVEISVDGHGQGARYGGGGHYQYVGRVLAFRPQFGTLFHAEAVLFVDYS